MFEDKLSELKKMSIYSGSRNDFVQGGGGNTSVKLDGHIMAVKASGYLLKDVTEKSGFAVVDYRKIREYYEAQSDTKDIVSDSLIDFEGVKNLRPSIETGFHAVLGKYIIHTHSVYANVLTCCENGAELTKSIFDGKVFWGEYSMPGDDTTREIIRILQENNADVNGDKPICILLKNHGIVVSANNIDILIDTHERINYMLQEKFKKARFVQAKLKKRDDYYLVDAKYIPDKYLDLILHEDIINKVIFPDQTVYILDAKSAISCKNGEIRIQKDKNYAEAMFYTLAAYAYISDVASKNNYDLSYLPNFEVKRLLENEHEKYRKNILTKI